MHPSATPRAARFELTLAAKHIAASTAGFALDFAILHFAMRRGLEPAWARVISLACAVNLTFVLNGLFVFGGLASGRKLVRQWLTYVLTNAFGNLCNYWIFVTLVSLHHAIVSAPSVALCVAAVSAWAINFAAARLLVFGGGLTRRAPPWAKAAWRSTHLLGERLDTRARSNSGSDGAA